MRYAALLSAVMLSACVVIDAADRETEHISQTAPLAPGGTLKLKNFSGRVAITGTDRQDASIDAVRRASRDRLDHVKLDIHQEGSTLVVNANRQDHSHWGRNNHIVDTDLTLQVPRRTSLDADVFSSLLSAENLEGSHRVHAFSAPVRFENVSGPIRVHTFSGAVDVRTETWDSDQSVDVDTFSGNVELHVPETAAGTVSFNSFSGHLHCAIPLKLSSGNRRSLRAELGSGSGSSLRFKTFSGSVRINR